MIDGIWTVFDGGSDFRHQNKPKWHSRSRKVNFLKICSKWAENWWVLYRKIRGVRKKWWTHIKNINFWWKITCLWFFQLFDWWRRPVFIKSPLAKQTWEDINHGRISTVGGCQHCPGWIDDGDPTTWAENEATRSFLILRIFLKHQNGLEVGSESRNLRFYEKKWKFLKKSIFLKKNISM